MEINKLKLTNVNLILTGNKKMAEEKTQRLLEQRNALRKPAFVLKESHFKTGVKSNWRKPRGKHSPVRQCHKGRLSMPHPGYGAPKEVYGLTREGKKPVSVQRIKDLELVDVKTDTVVIGSTVGLRKRLLLLKACSEGGFFVAGVDLKKELSVRDRQFANSKQITNARRKARQSKAKSNAKAKESKKEADKNQKSKDKNIKEDVAKEVKPEATVTEATVVEPVTKEN